MTVTALPASLRVFVGPGPELAVEDAIRAAGGLVVPTAADAEMVVWNAGPAAAGDWLHPGVRWVHLASAGVDEWVQAGVIDNDRIWMSGAGSYADAVADHALALILAARRRLTECARASTWETTLRGRPLRGSVVLVVGAGGIGGAVLRLLAPFGTHAIAVTKHGRPVEHAQRSVGPDALDALWSEAEIVVLTAPVTPTTYRMVNDRTLAAMRNDVLIVNVARGALVDTASLVDALRGDQIGGAALDVTDPEPLPTDHPLWADPRVLITPHVANPPDTRQERFAQRVGDNVGRITRGADPLAIIEFDRGY